MKKIFKLTSLLSQPGANSFQNNEVFAKKRKCLIILTILFSLVLCNCDLLKKGISRDGQDDRLTFKNQKKLTGSKNGWAPQIAANNSGDLIVGWIRNYQPFPAFLPWNDLYTRRSEDGGKNWKSVVKFSELEGDASSPALAVDDTGGISFTCCIVFHETNHGVYFLNSVDGGSNWSRVRRIGGWSNYKADMAVDSAGNINVAWDDKYDVYHIRFTRTTDNGVNWSESKPVSGELENSFDPAIVTGANGNIYVTWHNKNTINDWDIYFTQSADNGVSFSQPVNISDNPGISQKAAVVVSTLGNIYVVWIYTHAGSQEIYFSCSTDVGATWSQPTLISKGGGTSDSPGIAVDSMGNIDVVWVEKTNDGREIFFSSSEDRGGWWSEPVKISNNTKDARVPVIAVGSSGAVYVVWDNGSDVYFTRNNI